MAVTETLARVDWQLGQTLLPDHFIAAEDAVLAEVKTRFDLLGLPFYGIGRLKWNESLLTDGVLSIQVMTLVLPSGQLIDVPGNAAADTFNMNAAGATRVPVYLHLIAERAAPRNGGASGGSANPLAAAAVAGIGGRGQDGERLDRVVHRLAVTSEQTVKNAVQTFKLAEFEKGFEGTWALAEDYLPPMVQVGTSPFIEKTLERFMKLLELFHLKLQEDIAAAYLGGEGLFSAKLCLEGVYRLQRFIGNLKTQVHFHPYFLYEALKTFYIELSLFQNATPLNVAAPYLHDDLAGCLRAVYEPLTEQVQFTRGKTPYLAFERKEGLFVLPEIPTEVRRAREVYLLIQKPKITETLALEGFKVAARSRLPIVHQLALQGIPFTKIERPPFQHQFGAEVEFFLLHEGEEWDLALGEGSIAFYDQPTFAKVKAFIYWRAG
jgi:type VI secretion system protein ImpJ